MKLLIANKNYSSWSLRSWLLLRELAIPFEEEKLSFTDPNWKTSVLSISPAGRVPVLVDDSLVIWDTLSITEYVAEKFPDAGVWPRNREARVVARSICAEMHAGFPNIRAQMPMNIEAQLPGRGWNAEVKAETERIIAIWTTYRNQWAHAGPMLFGAFSAADAFYAPIVWRFITYGVELPPVAAAYRDTICALASMKSWEAEARDEHDFLSEDEPYRTHIGPTTPMS
ncbi:MAG: glutathione S-transferase family protein [Myxococcales bacterium]|nr:glutathione S-transferase family protein [Myxococcales bacterium]